MTDQTARVQQEMREQRAAQTAAAQQQAQRDRAAVAAHYAARRAAGQ